MRVLLIGLGDIARKAYLPVLSARPDIKLHLATRNSAVLEDVGRTFRLPHRYATVSEALIAARFDAAFVHTSTAAHPEIVRLLIEQDIPTFVDKPLAENLVEAEDLVASAVRRSTPLVVGFNRRFAPDYVALRGTSASLVTMEKHRHHQLDVPRRVVFDDFIHVVDTLLFLSPATVHRPAIETHVVDGLLHSAAIMLAGDGFTASRQRHR